MNKSERWIVYPLLFMAMGAAMHDKVARQVNTGEIRCKGLVVTGANDEPVVILSSSSAGGAVTAVRADQKLELTLGHKEKGSSLFVEGPTADGVASFAVLGKLRAPKRTGQWLPEFPLIDPQLLHPPANEH